MLGGVGRVVARVGAVVALLGVVPLVRATSPFFLNPIQGLEDGRLVEPSPPDKPLYDLVELRGVANK